MVTRVISSFQAWKSTTDGATAIEYGLIAAGIAVAISAVVFTFGDQLAGMFSEMSTKIEGAGAVE